MRALITAVAHEGYGAQLSRPEVEWLLMRQDGTVGLVDGTELTLEEGDPEVAWGTSDLFRDGAPIAAFFGALLASPHLAWFQSPAAGYDSPVFANLVANGTRVSNAHVNSIPIAEFVLRAVLDQFQAAASWRDLEQAGEWQIHDWREVAGSTWVIVGLGGIGTEVAVRAGAFGAHVIGCRRTPSPDDPTERTVTPAELDSVVGLADVVVLAAPATPETENLVDTEFLARLRPGTVLVNVARGTLVDEEALVAALDSGHLASAILDVFRTEPLPGDHPFWSNPRLVVTPHNAAGGLGRLTRQADLFEENLGHYLAGRPLLHEVTDDIAAAATAPAPTPTG
jgi:phosphoglycerate dehydrogenase-like enzyme